MSTKRKGVGRPTHKVGLGIGGLSAVLKKHQNQLLNLPMPAERQANVVLSYLQALAAMTGGYADSYHYDTLCSALNIGRILAEHGIGTEYKDLIGPAIDALMRVRKRHSTTGKYGLDGDGLAALRAVAGLHEAQMKTATLGQLARADAEVHERLAAGRLYAKETK